MSEPDAKKLKPTGWEDHSLNISNAVMKADEGLFLSDLAKKEITAIQGIGPKSDVVLDSLGVKTVEDLATYKFFLLARAIVTLAETEVAGDRPTGSVMNLDEALDKSWEAKPLKEIAEAPTSALQGLSEKARALFDDLKVHTIKDLAKFKYCRYAEAIVEASKFEQKKNAAEKKVEAQLKKLG